jgi:hypothetical protein
MISGALVSCAAAPGTTSAVISSAAGIQNLHMVILLEM